MFFRVQVVIVKTWLHLCVSARVYDTAGLQAWNIMDGLFFVWAAQSGTLRCMQPGLHFFQLRLLEDTSSLAVLSWP